MDKNEWRLIIVKETSNVVYVGTAVLIMIIRDYSWWC